MCHACLAVAMCDQVLQVSAESRLADVMLQSNQHQLGGAGALLRLLTGTWLPWSMI